MDVPGVTSQAAGYGTYVLAGWLFLRLVGLIYLVAFVSLARQMKGLIGQEGILPAVEVLERGRSWGSKRFYLLPTLCWLNTSDRFLLLLAWSGAGLSVLVVIGFAPALVLLALWSLYLSLFTVSRVFLGYQWDVLLLETGFLAIFLAPPEAAPRFPPSATPSPIVLWLMWWLLFRLMFSSGLAKLTSGDPTWRRLIALRFHYETQPLPTPVAWQAHQLPLIFHRASAAVMFGIEIFAPLLMFGSGPSRTAAAFLFIAFMVLIQLSGNYCFFNFLAIALSVLLLDDTVLLPVFKGLFPGSDFSTAVAPAPRWENGVASAVAVVILSLSLGPIARLCRLEINRPKVLLRFFDLLDPFRLVNSYGLFSVMTTERPEIIVEGSHDGENWQEYEFKWKPGNVKRGARFVAPHQPRLDWQMWFAALGYYPDNPWFIRLLTRLLEGSPAVLSLLKTNPFPNVPPRYIRGVMYDYRFTTRVQRRATGAWWQRERRGSYCPILELGRTFAE